MSQLWGIVRLHNVTDEDLCDSSGAFRCVTGVFALAAVQAQFGLRWTQERDIRGLVGRAFMCVCLPTASYTRGCASALSQHTGSLELFVPRPGDSDMVVVESEAPARWGLLLAASRLALRCSLTLARVSPALISVRRSVSCTLCGNSRRECPCLPSRVCSLRRLSKSRSRTCRLDPCCVMTAPSLLGIGACMCASGLHRRGLTLRLRCGSGDWTGFEGVSRAEWEIRCHDIDIEQEAQSTQN